VTSINTFGLFPVAQATSASSYRAAGVKSTSIFDQELRRRYAGLAVLPERRRPV
jgi:hypothetical protein